jgi:hypothetical protein
VRSFVRSLARLLMRAASAGINLNLNQIERTDFDFDTASSNSKRVETHNKHQSKPLKATHMDRCGCCGYRCGCGCPVIVVVVVVRVSLSLSLWWLPSKTELCSTVLSA